VGVLDPFRFVRISVAGWMNQQQQQAIEYLREENKVLREQLGGGRLGLLTNSAVDWLSSKGTRSPRSGGIGSDRHA
jgi:hypothetical protein